MGKTVSTRHNVPMGDFPNPQKFAAIMKNFEMWKIPALKPQEIQAIDEVLGRGVPRLLEQVEEKRQVGNGDANNPFMPSNADANPFDEIQIGQSNWIVSQIKKQEYDQKFYSLSLSNGKASGGQVKQIMMQSGLPNQVLGRVWQLADIDEDGAMTDQEFALCCYLLEMVKAGNPLPQQLPDDYIPPQYRQRILKQRRQEQQQIQHSPQTQGGLPPPSGYNDSAW